MTSRIEERLPIPEDLRKLAEREEDVVLSLYMPTRPGPEEPEENSLHLKNLLGPAEARLREAGYRPAEVGELLSPLERLLGDATFWRKQLAGLALFRSQRDLVTHSLIDEVEPQVVVGPRAHIAPLAASAFPTTAFFVLALSQGALRLLSCTNKTCDRLDLARFEAPASLEEALRYDDLQKPELQHHPAMGPGRDRIGPDPTATEGGPQRHSFHGHGESGEGKKTQIRRFFQVVARKLDPVFDRRRIPVVLAGVEFLLPLYREASRYGDFVEAAVEGNPELLRDDELHDLALERVRPRLDARVDDLKERIGAGIPRGEASTEIENVVLASFEGRIDVLFVRRGGDVLRGTVDHANRKVTTGSGDESEDLIELAVRNTVTTDGEIVVLSEDDMPGSQPLAALYRYSV